MKKISILIPCFNEVENVEGISAAIEKVLKEQLSSYDYEIVFIDNASTDGTRKKIESIIEKTGKEPAAVMPDFCHDDMKSRFDEFKDIKIIPTAGSNVFNTESIRYELKHKKEVFISYEAETSYALHMLEKAGTSGDVYLHCGGLIPWMQTDFCPVGRNAPGCSACKGRGVFDLKQETGTETRVVTHPD